MAGTALLPAPIIFFYNIYIANAPVVEKGVAPVPVFRCFHLDRAPASLFPRVASDTTTATLLCADKITQTEKSCTPSSPPHETPISWIFFPVIIYLCTTGLIVVFFRLHPPPPPPLQYSPPAGPAAYTPRMC